MSNTKECTLTDSELTEKVEKWVSDLCKSGGEKWCLRVPADHNHDPDFIFTEAARRMSRYASRISELEGKVEFYRRETSKLRDYLEEHKIGKPSQKLFDALYEHIAELEAENKRLRDALIDAKEDAAALIEEYRWIPVTERLPEPNVPVLASIRYGAGNTQYTLTQWNPRTEGFDYFHTDPITHWQPLPPQPPKEQ